MKFDRPHCPYCGADPDRVAETVFLDTFVEREGNYEFEWSSARASKVHWDTSTPVQDHQGKVTLICESGHEWQSQMTD